MNAHALVVVGIGHDGPRGLSLECRGHIAEAAILAGGHRQLDFFPEWTGERVLLNGDVNAFVAALRQRYAQEKTVVLASGDPLFFGIGRALLQAIPKEDLLVLPTVSSVQLAFARVKEAWEDAQVVSVHGRPLDTLTPVIEEGVEKIAVLTDANNHPAAIADLLCRLGAENLYTIWVCENLGGADERVGRYSSAALHSEVFSPLNVVILLRETARDENAAGAVPLLGIPEKAILHRSGPLGMITRREIRLLTLCYLELYPGNVLWDIGGGSGSVSIEAARLHGALRVFAIERDEESFGRLEANVRKLAPKRVTAIRGEAPQCLAELPDPDAVFVGGSGGRLAEILDLAAQRLRPTGRIVVNCITLETLMSSWQRFQQLGWAPEATSIQLAHSRTLGRLHNMNSENPIFIVRACKP
jgi:precorrin-6Y C5,15-methyltransferase (decarboxylating)